MAHSLTALIPVMLYTVVAYLIVRRYLASVAKVVFAVGCLVLPLIIILHYVAPYMPPPYADLFMSQLTNQRIEYRSLFVAVSITIEFLVCVYAFFIAFFSSESLPTSQWLKCRPPN